MTTTNTTATTAVTVTGTIHSNISLIRLLPDRVARASFRLDGADGAYNVHATGPRAELIKVALHQGEQVTVTAVCSSTSHAAQTIPDLEIDHITLDLTH